MSNPAEELNSSLMGCTDQFVWARKFVEMVDINPNIPTDEGTLATWFAIAIMSGWDAGLKHERERSFISKIQEIVYQAAGAASVPFMQDHPDYVFPSERIAEGVSKVLKEHGIPPKP